MQDYIKAVFEVTFMATVLTKKSLKTLKTFLYISDVGYG